MVIGIDFDNTIICYDQLFHRAALEQGLIPMEVPANKSDVRNYLRQTDREQVWTELQGLVYGYYIQFARPFPGVKDFFQYCKAKGIAIYIISHKTQYPIRGGHYDLRQAAMEWLRAQGFYDSKIGLSPKEVYFAFNHEEKIDRIVKFGCTHFIDDLPEFLEQPSFPGGLERILFDPNNIYQVSNVFQQANSWRQIKKIFTDGAKKSSMISGKLKHIVAGLFKEEGAPGVFNLQRLIGGANNKVFRLDMDERRFLLKVYFYDPNDSRDRLKSEFSFCKFAWESGIRCLPQPLAYDAKNHLALYEFIEGRQLEAHEVTEDLVLSALNFYLELNKYRRTPKAKTLPIGSESCFTIAQHLRCVQDRLERLKNIEENSSINTEAVHFIKSELSPAWEKVKHSVNKGVKEIGISLNEEIPEQDRCLSPSDFGFHNAILTPGGYLRFIDFEYAGWDDPVKMVCDFFCQPKVPVPWAYYDMFIDRVVLGLSLSKMHRERIALLFPVYQIKWCCILLNDFLLVGGKRYAFVRSAAHEGQKLMQLDKARYALRNMALN